MIIIKRIIIINLFIYNCLPMLKLVQMNIKKMGRDLIVNLFFLVEFFNFNETIHQFTIIKVIQTCLNYFKEVIDYYYFIQLIFIDCFIIYLIMIIKYYFMPFNFFINFVYNFVNVPQNFYHLLKLVQ